MTWGAFFSATITRKVFEVKWRIIESPVRLVARDPLLGIAAKEEIAAALVRRGRLGELRTAHFILILSFLFVLLFILSCL